MSSTRTVTSDIGVVVLYNTPITEAVTVIAKVSSTKQLTYSLRTFAERQAFVHLYPRKFQ